MSFLSKQRLVGEISRAQDSRRDQWLNKVWLADWFSNILHSFKNKILLIFDHCGWSRKRILVSQMIPKDVPRLLQCFQFCCCCYFYAILFNYLAGRTSYMIWRVGSVRKSGNFMSKLIIRSPRLDVSFGWGSPSPEIRLCVFGLTISLNWIGIEPPDSVGTLTLHPHKACKK